MNLQQDSIAAIASAPGRGGIGIVRVSGPQAGAIAQAIGGRIPQARHAHYLPLMDGAQQILDHGILLFFPAPHSFTGEDVLELQAHGGPVLLDMLLRRCLELGARQARPGEFSERAFLNNKLDLAQAEAIADLIDAGSEQAARNAQRSLQGAFSRRIHNLCNQLTELRVFIEAALDFPEEDIDFLTEGNVSAQLQALQQKLKNVADEANQGVLLREGMTLVIAGAPNAGKSSLLNALAERDSAIVTDIPGTTRDLLREYIHIDGMPLHIIDTAGLHESTDTVEQIGIQRALAAIREADRVLLVKDSSAAEDSEPDAASLWPTTLWSPHWGTPPEAKQTTVIHNKADISGQLPTCRPSPDKQGSTHIILSAKTGNGLDLLRQHLKQCMGFNAATEGSFSARRRHLEALRQAALHLAQGQQQLADHAAAELLAEELRSAHHALGEIVGHISSDALLGKIFSSFCIGK